MEKIINKNEIIKLLEKKIRYKRLKLPSKINFSITDSSLKIELSECTSNMQSDESAFEGWIICLKHHLKDHIETAELSWIKPSQLNSGKQLHYNRFLYRVLRFSQMFSWFTVSATNSIELMEFQNDFCDLCINTPLSKAGFTSENSSSEKKIEYNPHNLKFIKDKFRLKKIDHQLPVGIQKNSNCFFTGRSSAIDIWGIDEQDNLNIFELKYKNSKVGIITELLFYSEIMHDIFVSKEIGKPGKVRQIRSAYDLYQGFVTIANIKAFFLFDKLHPMVVGTTTLLNSNSLGIKFFNLHYKLERDSFSINTIFYKGAFQMEEEFSQAAFAGLKPYQVLLNDGDLNLHESIREDAVKYFLENGIDWWTFDGIVSKPTKHIVSSQIQCLNFLFPLRKDKNAVLNIAQLFDPEINDVLIAMKDKDPGYIAFEFTYNNQSILNEIGENARRGSFCTSIDAFIIAKRQHQKILIAIEWKYTENYFDCHNKALEPSKGKTRQARYNHLIEKSNQLLTPTFFEKSVYYYEPFYELMRQTLLIEGMVSAGIADDFLHILIVPENNMDLLSNNYNFTTTNLTTTWHNCLSDPYKFHVIPSRKILHTIENFQNYSELVNYLTKRY